MRNKETDGDNGSVTDVWISRAADALRDDERVRALWLTGSLAAGTGDAYSDIDLRAALRPEDFAQINDLWPELTDLISPTVWKHHWPGAAQEAIISAITPDYARFDLVIQSADDTQPRHLDAARLLFDKDGLADRIKLTNPTQGNPLAALAFTVEEFIRLLGMLPLVVGRDDVPIGIDGQFVCHSMLMNLLLMENGIDRNVSGKRHVARYLNDEQRLVLASVPSLAPTMESIIEGRMAYARIFLRRARRLMEANGLAYPDAFEQATLRYLRATMNLSL